MRLLKPDDWPYWVPSVYLMVGVRENGEHCGLTRLLYHWTIHVGLNEVGYARRYCYHNLGRAELAMAVWDTEEHPEGWDKDPQRGIYQDPVTGETWDEHEPRPRRADDYHRRS